MMKAEFEAWAWKYFVVKNSFAEAAWDEAYQAGALAMRERAAKAAEGEYLEWHADPESDEAYDRAIEHVAAAIRALPVSE